MRPRRAQGFSYNGEYRYFVTCCTAGRATYLSDRRIVEAVRLEILKSATRHEFSILAYTFMPDHLHFFIEGRREDADFRRFMQNWRKRTGWAAKPFIDGQLWQDGYFERVLRREEATQSVIDYILANPIRAGLVQNAVDYPFSWSVVTHDPIGSH